VPSYNGDKNQKPVLRLRMPDENDTIIDDLVQGKVSVANKQLDDLVLMRSDETPTYMLAVVVDDYDMGITHIIRGDDHLNNAIRQTKIYNALNWKPPIFGHIPLIHGTDGAKLSKRHGATGIDTYKNMGIYSDAMNNYLARLGWSHGDDEYFSLTQAISWFDGRSIGKSPARFDMQKLISVNAYWLNKQSAANLYEQILNHHHQKPNKPISSAFEARFNKLHPHLTKRASIISELSSQIDYLIYDGAPEIDSDVKALITDDSCTILKSFCDIVDKTPLDADAFQSFMNSWLAEKGLKMKDLGIPLRIVLTGNKSAPALCDLIHSLGFDEVKYRIDQICN
jgi:glutamyl-tRNA synthetase